MHYLRCMDGDEVNLSKMAIYKIRFAAYTFFNAGKVGCLGFGLGECVSSSLNSSRLQRCLISR